MSNDSYEATLDRQWDDIGEPAILPGGKWLVKARQIVKFQPKEEGKSVQAVLRVVPIEPSDDVDEDAIDSLGDGYDVTVNEVEFVKFLETEKDWADWKKAIKVFFGDADMPDKESDTYKAVRDKKAYAILGKRTFTNRAGELETRNTISGFLPLPLA